MGNIVFKLNSEGVRKMLQSAEMENLVLKEAEKRASADDEVHTFIGFDRVHAVIRGKEND